MENGPHQCVHYIPFNEFRNSNISSGFSFFCCLQFLLLFLLYHNNSFSLNVVLAHVFMKQNKDVFHLKAFLPYNLTIIFLWKIVQQFTYQIFVFTVNTHHISNIIIIMTKKWKTVGSNNNKINYGYNK